MSDYGTDDIYKQPVVEPESSGRGKGLTKEAVKRSGITYGGRVRDNRIFDHDKTVGSGKEVSWHVSKDDRLPAGEAAAMVKRVERAMGIETQEHEFLEAFWDSVFFYHTINGGSTVQPGRYYVQVSSHRFDYATVIDVLGVDQRRFFRTLADNVRAVNKKVLAEAGNQDINARERYNWLMQVATERGLARYPDLAHDSADACWQLDPSQRAAIANSKMAVTSRTTNFADSFSANSRIPSKGGLIYDNPAVARGYNE